ncbi:MAG: c-type cytochrome [Betaproteobacteria bacterium]|nr:c-type cytochrome [Betaproteobacteria bacterium]
MTHRSLITLAACAAALSLFVLAPSAHADGGKDLARSHGCFTCHAMSGMKVGPAFDAIAAKFAGKTDEETTLVNAIRHGETGTFGAMAMPANPAISEADAKVIADWIATLKK